MVKIVDWNGSKLHCIEWKVDGEIEWCFFGKEVVQVLGYQLNQKTTAEKYIKKYCDEEDIIKVKAKELREYPNPSNLEGFEIGRKGESLLLETGVYELILNSNLPQAKEFKKFVKQLLKQLREKAGLEQFEMFRMMDKQIQLNVQKVIAEVGDLESGAKNCIRANLAVNELISCELFKFNEPLNKSEMEKYAPMMLVDRQEVQNKYMDYLIASDGSHKKAFELTSKWIRFKYGHLVA